MPLANSEVMAGSQPRMEPRERRGFKYFRIQVWFQVYKYTNQYTSIQTHIYIPINHLYTSNVGFTFDKDDTDD